MKVAFLKTHFSFRHRWIGGFTIFLSAAAASILDLAFSPKHSPSIMVEIP